MSQSPKSVNLHIRVSPAQRDELARRATASGFESTSAYVLARALETDTTEDRFSAIERRLDALEAGR